MPAMEIDTSAVSSPTGSADSPLGEKQTMARIEQINSKGYSSRDAHDSEKGGLRTYGDGADHDHEAPMTFRKIMSLIAMAFLWTGSQMPIYLFGGIPPYIYSDIGGVDRWIWFVLAYLLALAAVCPFVGSISDLIGRRWVAISGAVFIVVGMIVCSTAHEMNVFIGGMTLTGIGAGINELTSLAVTSELAPTSKRGKYVAVLIFTIIPFCPSVMYGQLIAHYSTWRWIGLLCGAWAFIGLTLTVVFYYPPPRVNSMGKSKAQVLSEIDYIGGFLSVGGMILFMCGMQWGGYQYKWTSAHTLVPFLLGAVMLIAFVVWESRAPHPMFPRRLRQDPRVLALTLVITFVSGANFFSILMFWPTEAFNVYGHDPVGVGLRGLPIGFSILAGAVIVLVLLSTFKGHIRELMIVSSVLMTAGISALSIARPDNMYQLWGLLVLGGLGIGGIVVPASIITTIICPDDLIATVAALTLAVRVIGGSVGYCVYYNVFVNKFAPAAVALVGGVMEEELGIVNVTVIGEAIELTAASLLPAIGTLPGIAGVPGAYELVVAAGQTAYAHAYSYVYLVSIAFGAVSIIASCFLGDISKYMDDHVAVVM